MQALINYLSLLIPGLLGIGIVLFLHELGHFITARFMKVDVDVLSFGIGPKLFSIHGLNTEFRFSMIPFGGYCRMKGSMDLAKALRDNKEDLEITEKGSYFSSSAFVRFLIYFSGPLTNFILTAILVTIAALIPVERLSDPAIIASSSDYPSLFSISIDQPEIEKGDLVLGFKDYQEFERYLQSNNGKAVDIEVLRDGEIKAVTLYPFENGESYIYGITMLQEPVIGRSIVPEFMPGDIIIEANNKDIEYVLDLYSITDSNICLTILRDGKTFKYEAKDGKLPFAWKSELRKYGEDFNFLTYGISEAFKMFKTTLEALGALFSFDLTAVKDVIVGPMKAASSFGEISTLAFQTSTNSGFRSTLYLLSIVSISICVGNLLPIPTFDGGQMVITVAEMLKKGTLRPKTYLLLQIIGMVIGYLIIVLMYLMDIINLL